MPQYTVPPNDRRLERYDVVPNSLPIRNIYRLHAQYFAHHCVEIRQIVQLDLARSISGHCQQFRAKFLLNASVDRHGVQTPRHGRTSRLVPRDEERRYLADNVVVVHPRILGKIARHVRFQEKTQQISALDILLL